MGRVCVRGGCGVEMVWSRKGVGVEGRWCGEGRV